MSDSDGLAGNSSSNGGGVINDGGAVGAGHTTLSGAVEQADKAIRDSAASVIGGSDIDWNLFCNDLRRLTDVLFTLDEACLHLRFDRLNAGNLGVVSTFTYRGLPVPLDLRGVCAFDPAKAENGGTQEDDGSDSDQEALRRE